MAKLPQTYLGSPDPLEQAIRTLLMRNPHGRQPLRMDAMYGRDIPGEYYRLTGKPYIMGVSNESLPIGGGKSTQQEIPESDLAEIRSIVRNQLANLKFERWKREQGG